MYYLIGYGLAVLLALTTEAITGFLFEKIKSWIIERFERVIAQLRLMLLGLWERCYRHMDLIPLAEHQAMVEARAQECARLTEKLDCAILEHQAMVEARAQECTLLKEKMDQAVLRILVGMSNDSEGCLSLGPLGVPGGEPWAYKPEGKITQIIISYGLVVDSLIFLSESTDGSHKWSQKCGGGGGHMKDSVCFNSPSEHLTSIHLTIAIATFCTVMEEVISSITFRTNVREYGPFGTVCRTSFSLPIMEGSVIVGFNGRATRYLKAVGILIKPPTTPSLDGV